MGISIDEAIEIINHYLDYPKEEVRKALLVAIDTMRKYQKMQADYETRLKADMVANLKEIQLEIEELDFFEGEEPINITQELMDEAKSWEYGIKDCKKLVQEKINALKGDPHD